MPKNLENCFCTVGIDEDIYEPSGDVQKKIIPWRSMLPSNDLHLDLETDQVNKGSRSRGDGLILVTSLIDKPTNLGGESKNHKVFSS